MKKQDSWNPWQGPRKRKSEFRFVRYGMALLFPAAAAIVILLRPSLSETPFFLFLGAVVITAAKAGLAPAFWAVAISSLLIRVLFVHPQSRGIHFGTDFGGMERMGFFVLVSILLSCFIAAVRRERNQFRDSEERYRLLAETASDAIIVIDEREQILYVNAVAEKTFGAPAVNLLGQSLSVLLPSGGYQTELNEMKHRLDTRKKPVVVQLPGLRQCGAPLLIEMTLGTSTHRGKGVFTAIMRDVTQPTS